jgi:hypothetical protein
LCLSVLFYSLTTRTPIELRERRSNPRLTFRISASSIRCSSAVFLWDDPPNVFLLRSGSTVDVPILAVILSGMQRIFGKHRRGNQPALLSSPVSSVIPRTGRSHFYPEEASLVSLAESGRLPGGGGPNRLPGGEGNRARGVGVRGAAGG